jgi:hypothetical protein
MDSTAARARIVRPWRTQPASSARVNSSDLRREPREDRPGAAAAESPLERRRFEPFDVEPDGATRGELDAQRVHALLIGSEIKTLAPFIVRKRQQLGVPRFDHADRVGAGPIRARRPLGSQRLREIRKMGVDLVLQQRRRCRGASEPGFARVDCDDPPARRDQRVGDHRPGDAGAHDRDVEVHAGVIAVRVADAVAHEPVRLGRADAMRETASEGPHSGETRMPASGTLWVPDTHTGSAVS